MPFTSQNYGTFTGPQSTLGDYIYDTTALEGTWPTEIPVDTTFKLTDIAAVFSRIHLIIVDSICMV